MYRKCELCETGQPPITLHRQAFILPCDNSLSAYDVVACPNCNFLYASSQNKPQSDYYINATHHLSASGVPEGLSKIHHDFIDFIENNCAPLSHRTSILDVGASAGHFLNLFKTRGYIDLTGIEAAQNSSTLARNMYGIDVRVQLIDDFIADRKYELVTINGVLEHLTQLQEKVDTLSEIITPEGHLFIAVPDASHFNKNTQAEPFLEFASEHINFFTPTSIHSLLSAHKFGLISCDSIYNSYYGNNQFVAIYKNNASSVTKKTNKNLSDIEAMMEYISQGECILTSINTRLQALVTNKDPVAIWGVGQLTARLLANSELGNLNITRFIDNNETLHGSTYFKRQIFAPSSLSDSCETVIISSAIHHHEITTEINSLTNFSGKIVNLFDGLNIKRQEPN